jgi:hypothetical protein
MATSEGTLDAKLRSSKQIYETLYLGMVVFVICFPYNSEATSSDFLKENFQVNIPSRRIDCARVAFVLSCEINCNSYDYQNPTIQYFPASIKMFAAE